MKDLQVQMAEFFPVDEIAAQRYRAARGKLVETMNEALESDPDFARTVSDVPREFIRINHRNHADFMSTVFALGDPELLINVVPWVYRTYIRHGVSSEYFPEALKRWITAMREVLGEDAESLIPTYRWMRAQHPEWVRRSERFEEWTLDGDDHLRAERTELLEALLEADLPRVTAAVDRARDAVGGTVPLYSEVLQPVLYEVGRLWQEDRISVAREHLASSLVTRIMIMESQTIPLTSPGRVAVVTAAPSDLHEMGAWMVADALRLEGWNVKFLGAGAPAVDVAALVRKTNPELVAISATMPYHLDEVRDLVTHLRSNSGAATPRIIVGGQAFQLSPQSGSAVGADAVGHDLKEVVALAPAG